ncbi:hypothetical protein Y717_12370 [Streptomyces scopuliridis RB72]|uniref:Uncharacterized protein n=1 Tax=Streptomyces scopuliridis RB72 TaxID=1440053 RepID=A0A2T7SN78_9ACTN|nr:hypothetical protein Y717_12370 [Streptomyces scopuliridis RB72]
MKHDTDQYEYRTTEGTNEWSRMRAERSGRRQALYDRSAYDAS